MQALCKAADDYGIKVIVDIVANHLANNGSAGLSNTASTMGASSTDTTWCSTAVAEVNKFKNFFDGTTEYLGYSTDYNTTYNERGTSGVVISKLDGSGYVKLTANKMADGNYTDQVSGNTFTVSNGYITGTFGSTGVAVVYNTSESASTDDSSTSTSSTSDTDTLYLVPNSNWTTAGARFAMYLFNSSTGSYAWADMTDSDSDGTYEGTVPDGTWDYVIFCRMNGSSSSNSWSYVWNQTNDLALSDSYNCYTITSGAWSYGGGTNPGGGSTTTTGDYNIYIYGGDLYVNCSGDGLDSNGGLYLYGGTQAVFSMQSGGDNSPVDADGTVSIQGASIFAAGSRGADGSAQSSWFGSSQKYTSSTTGYTAGKIINTKAGSSGSVVFSYALPKSVNFIMASYPSTVSSNTPSFATATSVTACKGGSWSHTWNSGSVSNGVKTYTCTKCGATEKQTVPVTVSVAACDHSVDQEAVADEGCSVTFAGDSGVSAITVYHTQDYTGASESIAATGTTVSRSSAT